jgi:hypothetical protein
MNNADRYNMTSAEREYIARNNKYILREMERNGAFDSMKREIANSVREEIRNSTPNFNNSNNTQPTTQIKYIKLNTAEELTERDKYLKNYYRKQFWGKILSKVIAWVIIISIFMLLYNIPIVAILMDGFVKFIKTLFSIQ